MRNYKKLFPFLRPHLGILALAAVCMVFSSLLKVVQLGALVPVVDVILRQQTVDLPAWVPPHFAQMFQSFMNQSPLNQIYWVGAVLVTLFILKNLSVFSQTFLMNSAALRFLRDIRGGLYRKYQTLSLQFFGGERTGELISRITYDVSVLHNTITEGMANLVYQIAQVIFLLTTVVLISWKLTLFSFLIIPLIVYPVIQIGKVLRKLGFTVQERMADLNSQLVETLGGIRIVKAFTAEESEAARFDQINQQFFKASIRTVKRQEALASLTEVIGVIGVMFFVGVAARSVFITQTMTAGTLVLFMAALVSLLPSLKKISRIYAIHQQASTGAKRITQILETTSSVPEKPGAPALAPLQNQIQYQDVWFKYDKQDVLKGVDLTVRAGEVVALVGSSGAGKTTLLNLIPRFYDPQKGAVSIDGVDLRTVSLESVRRQTALVTQEPFLFHDTVGRNIAFGQPDASLEKIRAAAQTANADTFIQRFPQQYETIVGERGTQISGGERQRISIARAILKDAPILLLDEPTSQLDSESEALVQEALERLMEGRTVFIISHRLSTIRNADRIIVLDQGRIAEVGRHEQLLSESPLYRRLYELQVQ